VTGVTVAVSTAPERPEGSRATRVW
jgi:hypothetical protein